MSAESEFVGAIEVHAPDRLAALADAGIDVRQPVQGKPPIRWLLEMYTRSERFPACLRTLLDRGAEADDPALLPVLLDDADALEAALRADPGLLRHTTTLRCAFTPLVGASLVHVAAEFQCCRALGVLLAAGADVDARAAVDQHGLGGHTPLFHTVNANQDRAAGARELLLRAGAHVDVRIAGLVWGEGFEWETALFDLTPISYAQCGLLPQMHRDEREVRRTVESLLRSGCREVPPTANVPNRYLARG